MREITIGELITTGIAYQDIERNTPTESHMRNIQALIDNVLNPIMNKFPTAEIICGYISPSISSQYHGTMMSGHKTGKAASIWWCHDDLDIEQSIDIMQSWIIGNLDFNLLDIYDTFIDISYDSRFNYKIVNNLSLIHNKHIISRRIADCF